MSHLCGSVMDSGCGGAQENGTIVCYLPKEQHVHFPDLDMISQLLATRRRKDEELSTGVVGELSKKQERLTFAIAGLA